MAGLEIRIVFSGNKRVDADFGDFVIPTDQTRKNGGDEAAPEPYNLFLASIGTCAGSYVLAFCEVRKIPTRGISLVQRHEFKEPGHILSKISLEIRVPPDFPEKYKKALMNAAASCSVKKAIANQPEIVLKTVTAEVGS